MPLDQSLITLADRSSDAAPIVLSLDSGAAFLSESGTEVSVGEDIHDCLSKRLGVVPHQGVLAVLHIEAFGTDRCMIESNFPPDGRSSGFIPTMNAYKHILSGLSQDEKLDVFAHNAARVYRLDIPGL